MLTPDDKAPPRGALEEDEIARELAPWPEESAPPPEQAEPRGGKETT